MPEGLFRMPTKMKITGRTSSITNAFVNSIIPVIQPTGSEVEKVLNILGMEDGKICCSYCGGESTEWDHFRPLVINKEFTGYISEIANLVPACGKCNQSKGNKNWDEWIVSGAPRSPKSKNVPNLDDKIRRLKNFERWREPTKLDFKQIVGEKDLEIHQRNLDAITKSMRDAQEHAELLSKKIEKSLE